MRTITLLQTNGGTGKTTVALNLAYGLCNHGKKVLLIDTDSQANLTEIVLGNQSSDYFLNDILPTRNYDRSKNPDLKKILFPVSDSLFLIGSDPNGDVLLEGNKIDFTGIPYYLRTLLHEYENDFDYCIIDTPSQMSFFTQEAIAASDSLIIPLSAANYRSVLNFDRLLRSIDSIREKYNPGLSIEGILITCFSNRSQFREIKSSIETIAESLQIPLFPTPIHQTVKQAEATSLGLSVFEHCPKSSIAQDYQDMINQILEKEFNSPESSKKKEDSLPSSQPNANLNEDLADKDSSNPLSLKNLFGKREARNHAMSILVTESTYQRLKDLKKRENIAVNTMINSVLERFLDENGV